MGQRADMLFSRLMAEHARALRASWGMNPAACAATSGWADLTDALSFDAHVFACAIAAAAEDAEGGGGALAASLGLTAEALETVIGRYFSPQCLGWLGVPVGTPPADEEAGMVETLLLSHAHPTHAPGRWLASIIARRALEPNHLWQDLGLRDRGELNRLLATHFPTLAAGNTSNMKWKKYFYRQLCAEEGFVLCSAPSCAACLDFDACFGDESGESRLARARRAATPAESMDGLAAR